MNNTQIPRDLGILYAGTYMAVTAEPLSLVKTTSNFDVNRFFIGGNRETAISAWGCWWYPEVVLFDEQHPPKRHLWART